MKSIFTVVFFALFTTLNAQSIKGVLSDNQSPVSFANVMLYNAKDSTLVKFTYSDDSGTFNFDQLTPGVYYIDATFIGLEQYSSKSINVLSDDIDLGRINMTISANQLTEVTITAKKPLIEVKSDKVVLNVAGSVLSSGDDALSLLRKAPGVLVDNNENISLMGKTGLIIYIDGKPSPLNAAELASMLKNMSSNDIESIEIISNPSAKYEAQGTAGIINIKRKKLNHAGLNGSVTLTGRQGKTSGLNSGVNLNYKSEKLNLTGNLGYFNSNNWNYNDFYRTQNNLGFNTINENNNNNTGLNSKITGDLYLNKKSTFGFIAEFNMDDFKMTNNSVTRMGNLKLTQTDSLLLNLGQIKADSRNSNINTNYYYDGGNETTFSVDINYGRFNRENDSYTPNKYTTPDRSKVTSTFEVRSVTPTIIDIKTLKMDYEQKLGMGKISGGIKSGIVKTDNAFNFFNITDNEEILNKNLSNRFKYDEWVNAAYLSYNLQGKKISWNAGLRVENSQTKGNLIAINNTENKLVKRSYTNVFPSAGISYMLSEKHSFQFSYGRRINRPNYQDLNPFELQLDQLTYEKGNAFLNPEYADNLQLSHTFAQQLTTTFSYSHTSNVITRLVETSGLKGSYITWDNIAFRKVYTFSMNAPFSLTEKWTTYTNLNAVHTFNKADFGHGKIINLNVSSFNMYHQQAYAFNNSWNAEISAWYTSPSVWEGTFVMNSMWAAGAGVSKKFADNKAKVTLNIDDIFRTNVWRGESNFSGLYMDVSGGWDSRRVRLTFTYNFGNQNSGKSRNRNTGLEEEQNRIKKS